MGSISKLASDPAQYDKEHVKWSDEGSRSNPIRELFTRSLKPILINLKGKKVLDIGCGQGWLCSEISIKGANVVGIDPSSKNIKVAKEHYPNLNFQQVSLQGFESDTNFDLITAVMVFEHFYDLKESYKKISSLLKEGGKLYMIVGDFEKFISPRHNYIVQTEELRPGEIATRTDRGTDRGVLYDINRSYKLLVKEARESGFSLTSHKPILTPDWLIKKRPFLSQWKGLPIFHLLVFQKN